tara:strand:+ start:3678 stop:4991 length:1314 start_codon:yes stop_codon:yes gene_type:complete
MILIAILFSCFSFYILLDNFKLFNNKLLKIVISIFLSVSFLSFSFSLSLFTGMNFTLYQILFLITPIIYCIVNYKYFTAIFKKVDSTNFKLLNSELAIILFCLVLFTSMFFFNSLRWGRWDAWAIWSLHAKFLYFNDQFASLFTNNIIWTHPDYPLMLPSLIASIWKSLGIISPMVPLFISYFTAICLLLLVLSSFFEFRFKTLGIISFIVVLSSILLDYFSSSQYSDTLLSVFILIPIVLKNHFDKNKSLFFLILIGFFAATNGWIKNEGVIFFVIFFLFFSFDNIKKIKNIIYFLLGALIPLLFIIYFKTHYAPVNDLVNATSIDSLNKLTEINRYSTIYDYLLEKVIYKNSLLIILLISAIAIDYKYCLTFDFKVIISLFIIYFLVYVLTPHGLEWHLRTSVDRIIHHISPAIIYTIFFYFSQKYEVIFAKITS